MCLLWPNFGPFSALIYVPSREPVDFRMEGVEGRQKTFGERVENVLIDVVPS